MDDNTPNSTLPSGPKRLCRSRNQRMFLGICGGLAEYFDIDPTVVRLIFAAGVLVGGASIAVYAVLALIMPSAESIDLDPRAAAQETLNEASAEVRRLADATAARTKSLFGRRDPPSPSA
ncbi:MAG TPA: PspC domain-containing protein [Thermomicrobiales bacterium]|nr:PspC domain-containing protein [Thermomicrobiales bacterium]